MLSHLPSQGGSQCQRQDFNMDVGNSLVVARGEGAHGGQYGGSKGGAWTPDLGR